MNFVLQFANWADFLAMGKHGIYVWSSYILSLLLLFLCILLPWLKLKRTKSQLQRHISRQAARQAAPSNST